MSEEATAKIPSGHRPRRWWISPLWKSLLIIYLPHLLPFKFGPMMESSTALEAYLTYFIILPGALLGWTIGRKLPFSFPGNSDGWALLGLGGSITVAIIFAVVMIGSWLKGWKRWLFLSLMGILSGLNALFLGALFRAG